MPDNNADEIMDKYKKELEEFFKGNSEKSFDEITTKTLKELEEEVKNTAEKKQKEIENDSKKKTITCPKCGKPLKPNRYGASITLKTYNFPLEVSRNVFYCRNCQLSIDPLNEVFNIFEGHKITIDLAKEIARSAPKHMSFKETKEELIHYLGFNISESVITDIAENIGNKIHQQELKKAKKVYENYEEHIPDIKEKDKKDCTLYIMADGSMLSIKTEDGVCWKENKLGMVYKDNNQLKRVDGKNIITEKEYISYIGGPEIFKKMLFKTALKNGYGTTSKVVFIGDGAKWLWNICDELFPDAVQILDYYHLSENVYDYAEYLYPDNEIKKKKWAESALKEIENGNINELIDKLDVPDNQDDDQNITNLKGYLKNNRHRINYAKYKKEGYCIGSGSVESANKKVIQQRLKQAGMHWSYKGGQSIASLRVKYCSNQWSDVEKVIYNESAA